MRISFISQVTRVQKATTVANDTSLSSTILVLFPEFHPGRPGCNFLHGQTAKFVPVTEPARLTGSYEEALSHLSKTSESLAPMVGVAHKPLTTAGLDSLKLNE